MLDTVIALKRPHGYRAEQGARFEVVFEKSRGFFGPDAAAFEAALVEDTWTVGAIASGDDDARLLELCASNLSVRKISERVGLSKSTVSRRRKAMRGNGGLRSIAEGNVPRNGA